MDGEIDPDELVELLDDETGDKRLRIVDIRDRRAFDRGHLPESECLPFPELTTRVGELEGASRIVTVCPHGVASQQAAKLIGSYAGTEDARVESLRGGIEAWQREVDELVATAETDATDAEEDEGPEAPF
jgi:rhodanese-related sulfurtransferase